MPRTETRRLLEDQILRIWGEGRTALVDENYADGVIDHMPVPGQNPGREALKEVVDLFRTALPDLRMHLHGIVAAGDLGVDFWSLEGTHRGPLLGAAPTGRRVRFSGIDMVRVRGGRIAELWHVEEMLQFQQQLGLDTDAAFGAPFAADVAVAIPARAYDPGAGAEVPGEASLNARERRTLATARTHIEELWAKGEREVAWDVYAPEVVDHNPAPQQRPGIDGILDVLGWLREAAPDLRMQIAAYVVEGDYAADRWVMTGTHTGAPLMGLPARNRPFRINGMDVVRLNADDRITDVWHVEEFASLRQQIAAGP